MNVTLIKSVAKLFLILYTYSVKTNLNFCESFYFDYHLRGTKRVSFPTSFLKYNLGNIH